MSLKFPISLVGKRIASWLGFGSASRELDGVEDYINLGDILDGVFAGVGKKFTVAAWIKYDTPTGLAGHTIMSKDDVAVSGIGREWNFSVIDDGVNSDGAVRVVVANSTNTKVRRWDTDSGYINNTAWNHVAFTYDQTKNDDELVTIYVNGEPRATSITSTAGSNLSIDDTPTPLVIGFFDPIITTSTWFGKGKIADVRIYDTDIGSTKILSLSDGQDIQNNLVGHWLKDTDDFIDHSINSNDGENGFEPDFSTDAPPVSYTSSGGASRNFNGLDDMFVIPDNNIFSFGNGTNDNAFSVAAWVKMDSADKFRILSKYQTVGTREWILTTTVGKKLILSLIDETGGTSSAQRTYDAELMDNYLGIWTHIAGTYDGSGGTSAVNGIKLYINGSEVATVDTSSNGANYVAMNNTTSPLTIGGEDAIPARADGKIADVRLYDDVLTSGEVSSLYGGTDHTGNLIGHWIGDTDDFNDMSVNSNNGSPVGGSTYSVDGPKP